MDASSLSVYNKCFVLGDEFDLPSAVTAVFDAVIRQALGGKITIPSRKTIHSRGLFAVTSTYCVFSQHLLRDTV